MQGGAPNMIVGPGMPPPMSGLPPMPLPGMGILPQI